MNFDHRYKLECDSMRLLIDEFEKQADEYNARNKVYISEVEGHDLTEYHPPKYISNYKTILTSLLLTDAQGLLDLFLPIIVGHISQVKKADISTFDKSWKGGNVLCWCKIVLKNELGLNYDFSRGAYGKLKDFYEFRNDQIHNGGYLSSDKNRHLLNGKKRGLMLVRILGYTSLISHTAVA